MQIADVQAILKRIDVRLAELQMPKREFYQKSGISSGSFSQWNTGTHVPTTRKLSAAAKVLGVPLEYLLYGESVLTQNNTAAPQGDDQGIKKGLPQGEADEKSQDDWLKQAEHWSNAEINRAMQALLLIQARRQAQE